MTDASVFERYCSEIIEQNRLFRETLTAGRLDAQVPACPGWTLRDLAIHLGSDHLRAAQLVRTKADTFIRPDAVPGYGGPAELAEATASDTYAELLGEWLSACAQQVSDELRLASEESPVWTLTGEDRAFFWARRRTLETLVHRADAAQATGGKFEASPELAADCMDEFLELTSSGAALGWWPAMRTLAERDGDSLHLHATDSSQSDAAEWLIRIGNEGFGWTRAHEKATAAARGPVADLLLVLTRRLSPADERVEMLGDRELLDFWLERVGF